MTDRNRSIRHSYSPQYLSGPEPKLSRRPAVRHLRWRSQSRPHRELLPTPPDPHPLNELLWFGVVDRHQRLTDQDCLPTYLVLGNYGDESCDIIIVPQVDWLAPAQSEIRFSGMSILRLPVYLTSNVQREPPGPCSSDQALVVHFGKEGQQLKTVKPMLIRARVLVQD